jgi:hypothetical protein
MQPPDFLLLHFSHRLKPQPGTKLSMIKKTGRSQLYGFCPVYTDVVRELREAALNKWFDFPGKVKEWIDQVNMGK